MNERFTGIAFGTGPIGYKEGPNEKQIREVVEKIEQETKEAGLPWWAGMFNPEIVKLTNIERSQCNCAKDETESTKRVEGAGKPEETTEEKWFRVKETPEERQFREMEEQRERLRQADELVIEAIRMEVSGMEKLEELLKSTDTKSTLALEFARNIAEAGNTVARLRAFYGYGV